MQFGSVSTHISLICTMIIAMDSYSNSESYDAMASLDNVFAPHILDCIYSEEFDEVTIPDEFLKVTLDSMAMLKNVRVKVTVCARTVEEGSFLAGNHTHFCAIGE